MRYLAWMLFLSIIFLSGCYTTSKVRITADIDPKGEVKYHTEYEVEF